MKRIKREDEPIELEQYRGKFPNDSWDGLRANNEYGGNAAYIACRRSLISGQGGICAYCEIGISERDPLNCRVEHYHPKSDSSVPGKNWGLEWGNMLAVCSGGSYRYGAPPYSMEPLVDNLSCDAHKDRVIQSGELDEVCEGWVLQPTDLPALVNFFDIEKSTGRLVASEEKCAINDFVLVSAYENTHTLVEKTIDFLNLNCDRLCMARLQVVRDIERNKKRQRESGFGPEQGLRNLARRYFQHKWPTFFTTIRICLGSAAEIYLLENSYDG